MISSLPTNATAAKQLLESDAAYFELGADMHLLEAASMSCMAELAPLHAACVVQRVQPARIRSPMQWLVNVEREVAARGFNKARIYLTERGPALETALREAGFRPRIEYGFLFKRAPQPATEQVTLREVLTEADWRAKTRLHCEADVGSDGYRCDGALWTELVRAKCATGGKRSFLIEANGEVCGSIGMIEMSEVIRLKNLLISDGKRRRGLGSSAVRTVARLAAAVGKPAGIFAVESGPGEATYRSLGMELVTQHTEWTKQL